MYVLVHPVQAEARRQVTEFSAKRFWISREVIDLAEAKKEVFASAVARW